MACGTDLRPCEVSTVSRTTWMSSVRLGSSPWSSILLVCRWTRTRSLMLWGTMGCNINIGLPACTTAPEIQRGGNSPHYCSLHPVLQWSHVSTRGRRFSPLFIASWWSQWTPTAVAAAYLASLPDFSGPFHPSIFSGPAAESALLLSLLTSLPEFPL